MWLYQNINITYMFSRKILNLTPKIAPFIPHAMSVFVQKLNPLTGKNEWIIQNEHYDYHQEVARSAFADMLHDTERNKLYEKALKIAIDKVHAMGHKAIVLDIGTGTGLLSMMAVRNGADKVTACEAFKPMSECALRIIELNGFKDKIKVIPKRSTELTVGENGDLEEKCNILVTEVFDTELIGEGALSTFDHAHKHLLEKECVVVPDNATIYAQVVECPLAQNSNKLKDIYNDDLKLLLKVPDSIRNCAGSAAVHDIQLSQLPVHSFNTIVPPTAVLRFDWSGKTPFVYERSTINTLKAQKDGKAQMVFMWWELQMDINGEHVLSCAPYMTSWRDHWMQAIYYLPQEVDVKTDEEIHLISCHDEYSLWFNLTKTLRITDVHYLNPICTCAMHALFSRTRIGQMNDATRIKKHLRLLEENSDSTSSVLFLSDAFHVGLAAAKMYKKLYFLDTNLLSRRILQDFIDSNHINNVVILEKAQDLQDIDLKSVRIVYGEPYFTSNILPWDGLLFLYLSSSLRSLLHEEVKVVPEKCVVKAVVVHFDDLHKIREPLGQCEGFLMKTFDDLIMASSKISDDNVEAQPLWEYPATALTNEITIAEIDITSDHNKSIETHGNIHFEHKLPCNGLAIWVDWQMDDSPKNTISTGPTCPIEIGKKIQWDMYTRQGVHLFPGKTPRSLSWEFSFDVVEGDIKFKCA